MAELIRRGLPVVTFNQRSIAEILQMIRMLGGLVGCQAEAEALAERLEADLERIRESASRFPRRLRAFFEEWDDPLISGIRWVEELVEIAGADPIFPELSGCGLAKDRIVDPAEVARRDPEVIFASWCGKKMKKATIQNRPGWDRVAAVRDDRIFEIKSTYILQPGPACLTDGIAQLHAHLSAIAPGLLSATSFSRAEAVFARDRRASLQSAGCLSPTSCRVVGRLIAGPRKLFAGCCSSECASSSGCLRRPRTFCSIRISWPTRWAVPKSCSPFRSSIPMSSQRSWTAS